jgi:hypothetical protein
LDGSNAAAVEFTGLKAIVGTGAYAGITHPVWNSYVDSTAKAFVEADLDKAFMKATKTGKPALIIMNATEFTKYASGLTAQQRFGAADTLYAGWKTVEYMGGNAQVVLDFDCPDDTIYILTPDDLYYSQLKALSWLPGEKGVLRGIPQTLNYEAIASYMGAIWALKRNSHSKLTNRVG